MQKNTREPDRRGRSELSTTFGKSTGSCATRKRQQLPLAQASLRPLAHHRLEASGQERAEELHRRYQHQPARVRDERHTKIDAGSADVHGGAAQGVRTKRHEPVGMLQIQLRLFGSTEA